MLNALSRPVWPARTSSPSRASTLWLVLAFGALVISVFRVRAFPADDAALFEYVGRSMVHGQRLYADIWDNKLPSIYVVNAVLQLLFGSNYLLHTIAEVAVNGVSVILFAAVLQTVGIKSWAPCTFALALTLSIATILDADEYYALAFIMFGYFMSLSRRSAASAGIALAIATTFWIPSILLLIPLCLENKVRRAWVTIIYAFVVMSIIYAVGMVITFGAGIIAELVTSWFSYLTYHQGTEQPIVGRIYTGLLTSGAGVVLAVFAMAVRKPKNGYERFALWWSAVALIGAVGPLKFYPHYFVPTFPPLIFAIGIFGFKWRIVRPRLVLVAVALFFVAKAVAYKLKVSPGVRSQASAFLVGDRIHASFGSGTVIYTPDYAPEVYLAADAALTDRFALAGPANVGFMKSRRTAVKRNAIVVVELTKNHVRRDVSGEYVEACKGQPIALWTVYIASQDVSKYVCK